MLIQVLSNDYELGLHSQTELSVDPSFKAVVVNFTLKSGLSLECLEKLYLPYLSKYCIPVSSIAGRSHLHSAASGDLFIPANTVTIGSRAFAVACPAAWNSLPPELHDKSLSLMTFLKKLKTYLFKIN